MTDTQPDSSLWSRTTLRVRVLVGATLVMVAALWILSGRKRAAQPNPNGGTPSSRERPNATVLLPTRLTPQELTLAEAEREAPEVSSGYRREVVRPKPVQNIAETAAPREEPAADEHAGSPASRRRDEKKTLPEIFRMPSESKGEPPETTPVAVRVNVENPRVFRGESFAPYGRLIKCLLVDTVDSVTARSEPIVALVTQDLSWNGNVVIPAGTEAFSYAKPEAILDTAGVGRLVDTGEWTLVMPGQAEGANGRELLLKARAIDRREIAVDAKGKARSWALDDGVDGLIGYTLSTLDNREIKLFAAAAIGGMSQGIATVLQRQEPVAGISGVLGATQPAPTLGNAATGALGAGATEVMNEVAGRIRQEISKRGVYVRIPAGKEFYLFVEQTIDPSTAAVGLKLPTNPAGPG